MKIHKFSSTSPSNLPEKPDFMGLKVRKYSSTQKRFFDSLCIENFRQLVWRLCPKSRKKLNKV